VEVIPLVVPVFNRPDYTEAFLRALSATTHGARVMPILVDNGSRRRTRDLLDAWVASPGNPEVEGPKVIRLPENKGFAGGCNAALDDLLKTGAFGLPLVCLMHNDTIPFPGWLGEMAEAMGEADEDVVAIVPMTNYANEHSMCVPELRSAFEAIKPCNKNRLSKEEIDEVVAKLYPDGKEAVLRGLREKHSRHCYSPEVACFCVLLRTSALQEVGLFDEEFWPRTFEDKFWMHKAERMGMTCAIAQRAFVHHFGNVTSDGPGFCFPDIARRNQAKFAEKCKRMDEETVARYAAGRMMEEAKEEEPKGDPR
jgi:GT2 family glycosyltransferase